METLITSEKNIHGYAVPEADVISVIKLTRVEKPDEDAYIYYKLKYSSRQQFSLEGLYCNFNGLFESPQLWVGYYQQLRVDKIIIKSANSDLASINFLDYNLSERRGIYAQGLIEVDLLFKYQEVEVGDFYLDIETLIKHRAESVVNVELYEVIPD